MIGLIFAFLTAVFRFFADVIITGFLILGEIPGLLGGLGVLFVLFGVYVLEIGHISKSLLAPIKEISSDKGVQIVFVIMVIYSITAPVKYHVSGDTWLLCFPSPL